MKRILILATVSRQFHLFERVNIAVLRSLGYEVHAAANFDDASPRLDEVDIVRHHIPTSRNPLSPMNILALWQVLKILKELRIDAIHCHSPIGGLLGRLAGWLSGVRPILYTAHGFHFHRGSSRLSWLVYFPVERFLSRFTDVLLTINSEDTAMANKMHAGCVREVPGIGVPAKYSIFSDLALRSRVREEIGVTDECLVLFSVGELYRRKNYETVLQGLARISDRNWRYFICGQGESEHNLRAMAKDLGIADRVAFLGYRDDIPELLVGADVFIHASFREGLPVAVMEAMHAGLPCLVSRVRGNVDLIEDGVGGYVVDPLDSDAISNAIGWLGDEADRARMGLHNRAAASRLTPENVTKVMHAIYSSSLEGGKSPHG